jgi:hypothetical protein
VTTLAKWGLNRREFLGLGFMEKIIEIIIQEDCCD